MNRHRIILYAACLMLVLTGCTGKTNRKTMWAITDHDDDAVTVPVEVKRVVFTGVWPLPSVATVFLGGTDKFVGIPPASKGAARAGLLGELFPGMLEITSGYMVNDSVNIEEVLKLKPDIVFGLAGDSRLKQEITAAGIPVAAFSVSKWNYNILETYDGWIDLLGQVFPENSKKDRVSKYSKKVYAEIQDKVKNIPDSERKKVLFLFQYSDKNIITSGKRFFGQFWCEAVGAKNAAEEVGAERSNAVINMEQIYTWNPDIILITNFTPAVPDDLYHNTVGNYDWSTVKAVRDRHVYKMPLGTYRSYTPSADTPVTLYWVAQKVYPELFDDIDIIGKVKSYFKDMYSIDLTNDQIDRMYNQTLHGADGIMMSARR